MLSPMFPPLMIENSTYHSRTHLADIDFDPMFGSTLAADKESSHCASVSCWKKALALRSVNAN
ncbi:hypothetical protein SAMD00023353_0602220 [Rosellinia necatrix]|uniref:Uncharacterized protein n=1 Tax=Rosellinia necatrix TaxID=77044 RepID=A0A1S8A5V0_ROSNE|nr:hypothetical protein SAMD00023353_0602220 [Rosellinia necatrix]